MAESIFLVLFLEADVVLHSASFMSVQTKRCDNKCPRQELKCCGCKALLISSSTQI